MEGTDWGEWTLIVEGGAARTAMEEAVETEGADWEKPRLRSIDVLEEEDDAAWMLSLAISKLQTHKCMQTRRGVRTSARLIEGLRVHTRGESDMGGGERNREKNNQFRECYVLQEGIIIRV